MFKNISFINVAKSISKLIKNTNNPSEIFLAKVGLKELCDVYYRNGLKIEKICREKIAIKLLADLPDILAKFDEVEYSSGGITVNGVFISWQNLGVLKDCSDIIDVGGNIYGVANNEVVIEVPFNGSLYRFKLPHILAGIGEIKQVFINNVYGCLDYTDKRVLDVGGFIGDTAVFFVASGAKEVHSFEPNPMIFEFLKTNILLNNVESKVFAHCMGLGVGARKEKLLITDSFTETRLQSYVNSKYEKKIVNRAHVRVGDVFRFLDEYKIDIIKLDCEGCEYEILRGIVETGYIQSLEGVVAELHSVWSRAQKQFLADISKFGLDVNIIAKNNEELLIKITPKT